MKIAIPLPKPRNPIAAAARARQAGCHRFTSGAVRQRSRRELRQALDKLRKDSP